MGLLSLQVHLMLTCEGTELWLGMGGHPVWPQKALGSSRQGLGRKSVSTAKPNSLQASLRRECKHTVVSLQTLSFGCFLLPELLQLSPELVLTHSTVMPCAKWFCSSVKLHFA